MQEVIEKQTNNFFSSGLEKSIVDIQDKDYAKASLRASLNILEDFTLEKTRAEDVKKASLNILEDLEVERAKLEEAASNLSNANKELETFSYSVAHDLKAPLRAISTVAEWLKHDYFDKLDEKGKEQIDLLLNRTTRAHNLIDGILRYSRIGKVEEDETRLNCNEILKTVIDALAPKDNVEIKIEKKLPIIKYGMTSLEQVFQNLLSNAIKFNDKPKSEIKVNYSEEDKYFKFSIQDNGPGIDKEHHERIFQVFQTLKPRDEFESTGIGLSIVKKIIERHRGKIWIESELQKGSTFYFTIPK